MNRVKCILNNIITGEEYRYLVVLKDAIHTIDQFAKYVLEEYIHTTNQYSYTVLLDGFEIQKEEGISIIHQDDIILIEYKIQKKHKKEKKNEKKKKCKKTEIKLNEKKEKKDNKPIQPVFEKQNVNTIQDGFSYPENKITLFEENEEIEQPTPLLRILPKQVYSGGNTNTPTVNKKEDKKKTRRGKRGGRNNHSFLQTELPNQLEINTVEDSIISQKNFEENTPSDQHQQDELPESASHIQNQSYLDFIVQEQPSVIIDSAIQMKEETQEKANKENETNEPTSSEIQLPHIGDELRFPYTVMNYVTLSPEIKEIFGIVKNITSKDIILYSKDIDDMVHMSFSDYQNLKHFIVCCNN